jgi:membrane protein implicated in regulation of membrane protease activity
MVFLLSTPDYLVIIWAAVFILAAVIEASTMDLQSIWFSVGAFAALLAALFNAGEVVQIVVFFLVSIALLIGLRPIFKKYVKRNEAKTNVDRLIGKTALCIKDIPDGERGEVRIDGKIWTAIANEAIKKDEHVTVLAIEGVKLVVKKQ